IHASVDCPSDVPAGGTERSSGMNNNPEASIDYDLIYRLGQLHGATAIATAHVLGVEMTPALEGAEAAWKYSPTVPYAARSRELDVHKDGWYDAALASIFSIRVDLAGTTVRIEAR